MRCADPLRMLWFQPCLHICPNRVCLSCFMVWQTTILQIWVRTMHTCWWCWQLLVYSICSVLILRAISSIANSSFVLPVLICSLVKLDWSDNQHVSQHYLLVIVFCPLDELFSFAYGLFIPCSALHQCVTFCTNCCLALRTVVDFLLVECFRDP